jgi:hypothetical protein
MPPGGLIQIRVNMNEFKTVFEAHPDVKEIFVGTNGAGLKQPFFKENEALNFAGGTADRVQVIFRQSAEKKAPQVETAPAEKQPEKSDKAGK